LIRGGLKISVGGKDKRKDWLWLLVSLILHAGGFISIAYHNTEEPGQGPWIDTDMSYVALVKEQQEGKRKKQTAAVKKNIPGPQTAAKKGSVKQTVPVRRAAFSKISSGLELEIPVYPAIARRWGYEGVALLQLRINTNGRVMNVELLKSSGYDILDQSALTTVKKEWSFPPREDIVVVQKEFQFKFE